MSGYDAEAYICLPIGSDPSSETILYAKMTFIPPETALRKTASEILYYVDDDIVEPLRHPQFGMIVSYHQLYHGKYNHYYANWAALLIKRLENEH